MVNSFPWAYTPGTYGSGVLAVSDTVRTTSFQAGSGSGGEYTLSGTPTGNAYSYSVPSGISSQYVYDGTSDGKHNYYVQWYGYDTSGNYTENVYRTDRNWQNPVALFSVQSSPGANHEYLGIAYDGSNNSLWVGGGWGLPLISDYSMNGTLLSSFNPGEGTNSALGFDPADHTLWISVFESNNLEQFSTSGTLLQSGTPSGLPSFYNLSGDFAPTTVPEPTTMLLLGLGLTGLVGLRRKFNN